MSLCRTFSELVVINSTKIIDVKTLQLVARIIAKRQLFRCLYSLPKDMIVESICSLIILHTGFRNNNLLSCFHKFNGALTLFDF